MSRLRTKAQPAQLGFDALLGASDADNARRHAERAHASLPGTMEEALPYYRALLHWHNAAMLATDGEAVVRLRDEATNLARKLNNYEPGILADEHAPGCVLDRLTRAPHGTVPLWGQSGSFEIGCSDMRVHVEQHGLFDVGASFSTWLGFAVHAVDWQAPFLSETGYRSFLGLYGDLHPGMTPVEFARRIIASHVARDLKGKLVRIKPEYRQRHAEA